MKKIVHALWVLRAWLQFLAIPLALRVLGFERLCRWACRPIANPQPDDERCVELFRAVQTAGQFYYRSQSDCLPRALNTLLLLRSANIPAQLCIGVRKFPFEGHAWVECEARVLDDAPQRVENYKVLGRYHLGSPPCEQ